MTTKQFDFGEQLRIGKKYESILDKYFSRWYEIKPVTLDEERSLGIDRRFIRPDKSIVSVEYKTDFVAQHTGNIFIEIAVVQNSGTSVLGWALKTKADFICYYVVPDTIIIFNGPKLVAESERWQQYPERKVFNDGYYAVGHLVPHVEMTDVIVRILKYGYD